METKLKDSEIVAELIESVRHDMEMPKEIWKEPAGRKNGERRLFSSVNLRMEHIALVEEIALETGRTKTQVLGDMVQFAYDHIELYEEGEA